MYVSLIVLLTNNKKSYESFLCLTNPNIHLSYHTRRNSCVCDTSTTYYVNYVLLFSKTNALSIHKLVIILILIIGLCETSKFIQKLFTCIECGYRCLCVKNPNFHLSHHKEKKPSMYFILINIYCVIFVLLLFITNTFSIFKFVIIFNLIFALCESSESILKPFACTKCDHGCLCAKNPILHLNNHTGEEPFMGQSLINIYTHSAYCCSHVKMIILRVITNSSSHVKMIISCVITNSSSVYKCFEYVYKCINSCYHTGGKSYLCVTDYYHEYSILIYYLHTDDSNLLLCDYGIYNLNSVFTFPQCDYNIQYKFYITYLAQLVKYYIHSLLSKQKKSLFRIVIKNG